MFDWKPEFSVQIPAIDTQHQRLFALGAELHLAMAQGKGKEVTAKALKQLVDYTREHFAYEEQFMRNYKFPDLEPHKKQHRELTAKVLEFQERFRKNDACLSIDLLQFLRNWLGGHIKGSDQKYAVHIRKKTAA